MVVLSRAGIPSSTRLLSFSSSSPFHSLPGTSSTPNFLKTYKPTRNNCLSFHIKPINSVIDSKRVSLKTHCGKWEEPDDGNYSDYDYDTENEYLEQDDWEEDEEEEEEEEKKEEAEPEPSRPVGNVESKTQTQIDEEFIKEVEQLLEPEERAILEQNESPVLSKISTTKWRPFHTLALSGQIFFMDKLLKQGVDIDAVDKDGYTALHKAVIGKKEPVISHLLRKGANPHVRDKGGATPLHYAVQVGAVLTVKLLTKYKVDVNVADDEGWTPLHVAVQARSRDIAKILLVCGADKTRRNKDGKTPLDLSLCYGKDFKSYELAKLLKLVPANRDS